MKKVFSLVLILIMVTSALIGCGSKNNGKTETQSNETTDGNTVQENNTAENTAGENGTADTKVEEITLNIGYMPNYASLCSVVAGMKKGILQNRESTLI